MKIKVFCLPFAGASCFSYSKFTGMKSTRLEFLPLDLPGRGKRVREKLLTDIALMAKDLLEQIERLHNQQPYAIFGHSMGALLAVLIARELTQSGKLLPTHLFVSGSRPPSLRDRDVIRHLLEREEFINELLKIGGSPREILEDRSLMDFFEPILRADFQATETYEYTTAAPLTMPITCMIGDKDEVTYEQAQAWKIETTESLDVHWFEGDHFFILSHAPKIMSVIQRHLLEELWAPADQVAGTQESDSATDNYQGKHKSNSA